MAISGHTHRLKVWGQVGRCKERPHYSRYLDELDDTGYLKIRTNENRVKKLRIGKFFFNLRGQQIDV